jgi:twinkle protein
MHGRKSASTVADFTHHEPCPGCGSSDGLARYSDGSAHCFVCRKHNERAGGAITTQEETTDRDWTPIDGECVAIPKRGLTVETCRKWRYQTGEYSGQPCQIANFYDGKGRLVCQKLRTAGKKFPTLGPGKAKPLYGQWLFGGGGKHLVITEGELDALSVSQAFDNKWPVVSLPDGAQSAEKAIAQHYDWLSTFGRIVLMFDMDEPGQAAAEAIAPMLPPGTAAIATLPEKDANAVLTAHGPAPIVRAFWDAALWKPDGIVSGAEFTLEKVWTEEEGGYALPWPLLQDALLGLRKGELTMLTAGSGIGKSTLAREMAYWLHQQHGCTIGNVFLEEGNKKTVKGYVAIHNNVPLGRLRHNRNLLTEEQWRKSLADVVHTRMWLFDHFGSLDSKNLLNRLRYMATVCKVDFIILDHISIVTSGSESSGEGERKDIDILMTRLRSLIEETGVGVIAIVHLKRVSGKSFNDGAQVSLNDLRGSSSLEQLSDNVIALERNQQGEASTHMRVRLLKCRELGFENGECDMLNYNLDTGRVELASAGSFPDEL